MEDLKMDEDTADEVAQVQAEPTPLAQTRKVRTEQVKLTAEGKVKRAKKAKKAKKVREVEEEETEEEVGSFWQ